MTTPMCIARASVLLAVAAAAVLVVTTPVEAWAWIPVGRIHPPSLMKGLSHFETGSVLRRRKTGRLFMSVTTTAGPTLEFPDELPEGSSPSAAPSASSSSSSSSSSSAARPASSSSSSAAEMMTAVRQDRLRREQEGQARFVTGDDLHQLRLQVLEWRSEYNQLRSRRVGSTSTEFSSLRIQRRVRELERAILQAQSVDAEFVYMVAVERLEAAQRAGLTAEAEQYRQEAALARSALPQFNLEGLWVGKYGEQGFELINVTYVGDTLLAYKVTGDQNVPKGQQTFRVHLSPSRLSSSSSSSSRRSEVEEDAWLEPIELGEEAAQQWGSRFLPRFGGEGQVAAEGFTDVQWVEGQLILVNQYFSFAWLPLGHQVFFGRPSAELTLKLLRESQQKTHHSAAADDPQDNQQLVRQHLLKCLEETELLEEDMEVHGELFRSNDQTWYYDQAGCFE